MLSLKKETFFFSSLRVICAFTSHYLSHRFTYFIEERTHFMFFFLTYYCIRLYWAAPFGARVIYVSVWPSAKTLMKIFMLSFMQHFVSVVKHELERHVNMHAYSICYTTLLYSLYTMTLSPTACIWVILFSITQEWEESETQTHKIKEHVLLKEHVPWHQSWELFLCAIWRCFWCTAGCIPGVPHHGSEAGFVFWWWGCNNGCTRWAFSS